jgi:hypothetical protein
MKYEIKRVEDTDPMRCQAVNTQGQCHNLATVQGGFCPVHGGNRAVAIQQAETQRLYKLTKYRARLNELDSPNHDVKNLREEIGILRIVMEEIVNNCTGPVDILAHAPKISDLAVKIGKLISACHSIEKSLGQYLDKNTLIQVAQEIVTIIATHISDAEVLDKIITGIEDTLIRASSPQSD